MELKPINIKGKDYIPVNQRILEFWEECPNGRIITELVSDNGERCVFRCLIYSDMKDEQPSATGYSFEVKSASYINKTSYLENCETSAVGRALGMFGIGITESLASAEEVEAAQLQQDNQNAPAKRATKPKISELDKALMRLRDAEQKFCIKNSDSMKEKGITTVKQFHEAVTMARPDYSETIEAINRIADEFFEVLES